jgi:hypothetical protein
MRTSIKSALLISVLSSNIVNATAEVKIYGLYFPALLQLTKQLDSRIEGFAISVYCGHIEAISHIPVDWNIKINRAISTVDRPGVLFEELLASSGHGASMIPFDEKARVGQLDNMIRISVADSQSECFDVSADFAINDGTQHGRNIVFPRSKLELRP